MILDQSLSINDISALFEDLYDVQTKWYNFGMHLGVSDSTLQSLKGSDEENFREVLRALLNGSRRDGVTPITRSCILRALRTKTVNFKQLAAKLKTQYTSKNHTSKTGEI